jgi:hypothetical protein
LKISDKKRIYLSGYAKRKLKKEAEDAVSKLPKLTNFFKTVKNEVEVEASGVAKGGGLRGLKPPP